MFAVPISLCNRGRMMSLFDRVHNSCEILSSAVQRYKLPRLLPLSLSSSSSLLSLSPPRICDSCRHECLSIMRSNVTDSRVELRYAEEEKRQVSWSDGISVALFFLVFALAIWIFLLTRIKENRRLEHCSLFFRFPSLPPKISFSLRSLKLYLYAKDIVI